MYKSKCALLASDFTAETMSGYAQEPRGKFGKVHVKQNPRIEQWEQETGGVTTERVYASNMVSGADGYNKPGMRFQSPPRRPMVVATDAMGRIVSSYISPNPDKDGVIRKAEMVIEAYERRDNRDKYSGSGMHLIPAPKLSNNVTKAEEMAEQVLSAVTNRSNRPGGTNEYGRTGLGGMFRPQQPNFNSTDGWGRHTDTTVRAQPTYNDGYRGEFDGGRGSGPTAADARSNRASSVYPSTQASLPTQPAIDSGEAARRYNGKLV